MVAPQWFRDEEIDKLAEEKAEGTTADAEEALRQATLDQLGLLDTPAEATFDRITRVAQVLFDVPVALISLVDNDRQWFKSRQGLDVEQTPRDVAFCDHAIRSDAVFEIPNALEDERFANNPLVTENPKIRYYCGAPLIAENGARVGTLCLVDMTPRPALSEAKRKALADLAAIAMRECEVRATCRELLALSEQVGSEALFHGLKKP